MSRNLVRALVVVACAIGLVVSAGSSAEAGRKKKGKKKPHTMNAEQAKNLNGFMGAFKFGMTPKQVVKVVAKQIHERYAEKIAETTDVYEQDRLRRQQKKELKRFKKSYMKFEGKKTGWDVSIIDEEFRHRTGEAMMVSWETHEGRDQRRFFFFFRGRLYKMFIALNTSAIAGGDKGFDFFRNVMEARFGPGSDDNGRVVWRSKKVRAQAINKLGLYGSFCLSLADRSQLRDLREVREANAPKKDETNNIIEAIKDDGDEPDINSNSDTIDSIIGGN